MIFDKKIVPLTRKYCPKKNFWEFLNQKNRPSLPLKFTVVLHVFSIHIHFCISQNTYQVAIHAILFHYKSISTNLYSIKLTVVLYEKYISI